MQTPQGRKGGDQTDRQDEQAAAAAAAAAAAVAAAAVAAAAVHSPVFSLRRCLSRPVGVDGAGTEEAVALIS
jgi:hypothetical protein